MSVLRLSTIPGIVFLLAGFVMADIHQSWNALLRKHVQNGLVSYGALKSDPNSAKLLDDYLQTLAQWNPEKGSREEKLAFWINAYNAFTVKLIINHYPVKSIRDIKKPWKQKIWKAAGQTVSLDEIEHKILRKKFDEPRVHFAIVCASIGCPDLDNKAFRPDNLEEHLKSRAELFFQQLKNFKLKEDKKGVTLSLSKILKWFKDDFGKTKESRLNFIKKYLPESQRKKLQSAESVDIKYIDYDWNLNKR